MKAILTILVAIATLSPLTVSAAGNQSIVSRYSLSDTTFRGAEPELRYDKYRRELKDYDIELTMPEGFTSIDMRGRNFGLIPSLCPSMFIDKIYPVGLESDDNEAVFLYPTILFDADWQTLQNGYYIENELRAVHKDIDLDVRPLVDVYSLDDMSIYADADTVAIYLLDFPMPFLDRYWHCIGVYLRKYGHPAMLMKIALNDAGLENKEEYLRKLLSTVKYGSNPVPTLVERERNLNGRKDLDFPTKKRMNTGIIMN